jgi:hypothetical protein
VAFALLGAFHSDNTANDRGTPQGGVVSPLLAKSVDEPDVEGMAKDRAGRAVSGAIVRPRSKVLAVSTEGKGKGRTGSGDWQEEESKGTTDHLAKA